MLVSEGKAALKRYGFDEEDPLLTWLNAGLHQFEDAYDWTFLQASATVAALAGASTLTLPSDLFKVGSVRDMTNNRKLIEKDISWFEREIIDPTATGKASFYTIVGSETIQLWPVLDSDATFRVIYQTELEEMTTDTDEMPGPARIHYTIVRAAAFIGLQAENEEERAQTAQQQFEADVLSKISKFSKQTLDEPQQVADVMGYGLR